MESLIRILAFAIPGVFFGLGLGFPWWGVILSAALTGCAASLIILTLDLSRQMLALGLTLLFAAYVIADGSWWLWGTLEFVTTIVLAVGVLYTVYDDKVRARRRRGNPNYR